MATFFGLQSEPGVGSAITSVMRDILWIDEQNIPAIRYGGVPELASTAVDAGNTPTSLLRAGMLLGKKTSDGKLYQWDAAAVDGTQNLFGVLAWEVSQKDNFGNAVGTRPIVYLQAPIKASMILVKGTALTSATDQYEARRQLYLAGFMLDDDPLGYLSGCVERIAYVTGDTTVTAADNGTTFLLAGSGASTFTLPTLVPGLKFKFFNTADQNMAIASAGSSDDVIVVGDAAADSITFSTSTKKIGAHATIFTRYLNGTLKNFAENYSDTLTPTIA